MEEMDSWRVAVQKSWELLVDPVIPSKTNLNLNHPITVDQSVLEKRIATELSKQPNYRVGTEISHKTVTSVSRCHTVDEKWGDLEQQAGVQKPYRQPHHSDDQIRYRRRLFEDKSEHSRWVEHLNVFRSASSHYEKEVHHPSRRFRQETIDNCVETSEV